MSQILLAGTTLHSTMAAKTGAMGDNNHRQGAGLPCDPRPTGACPPSAFAFGLEMGGCGHSGYAEMLWNDAAAGLYRGAWKSGDGMCKRLLTKTLIGGYPICHALTDSVVRDMLKSSVFKLGRFPDTQY